MKRRSLLCNCQLLRGGPGIEEWLSLAGRRENWIRRWDQAECHHHLIQETFCGGAPPARSVSGLAHRRHTVATHPHFQAGRTSETTAFRQRVVAVNEVG